jgi:IS30 family transposase
LGLVLEKLELGWSPEQIAGRLKKEIREGTRPQEEYINHESIYQYIYDEEQKSIAVMGTPSPEP